MIYMQAILDMNDILMFEDQAIESYDFSIILLKKYFKSIVGINPCTNAFCTFLFFDIGTNLRLMYP